MSLADLPKTKWASTNPEVILLEDFSEIEVSILETFELRRVPALTWIDATAVKVRATADSPARLLMAGFPDVLHPGLFIDGGLSDGRYRANISDVSLDFDVAGSRWGTEKASQWYAAFALAGDADTTFSLRGMPWMRVKSQAGQVISLGNLTTPATGIGYGFTTDSLAGYKLYFLSGSSQGLLRTVSANNNDDGTGGTITYAGDPLSVAEGDWFIVLPDSNFRWLGDIFNNSAGHLVQFRQNGRRVLWLADVEITRPTDVNRTTVYEDIRACPPLAGRLGVYWCPAGATSTAPPFALCSQYATWIPGSTRWTAPGCFIGHAYKTYIYNPADPGPEGITETIVTASGAGEFDLDICKYMGDVIAVGNLYSISFAYPAGYLD